MPAKRVPVKGKNLKHVKIRRAMDSLGDVAFRCQELMFQQDGTLGKVLECPDKEAYNKAKDLLYLTFDRLNQLSDLLVRETQIEEK